MANFTGLKINTNIANVKAEFDTLLKYINTNLNKPFNIQFSIQQIDAQLQQISSKTKQLVSNKGLNVQVFNKEQLEKDGRDFLLKTEDIINQVKNKYKTLGDVKVDFAKNIDKDISQITATVTEASGVIEKFKYELSTIQSNGNNYEGYVLTKSSGTDNTEALAEMSRQKSQSINNKLQKEEASNTQKQENILYQESLNLLNRIYDLENQINIAKSKGYETTVQELEAQRSQTLAEFNNSTKNLSSESKISIINQENSLLQEQAINSSKILDKETQQTNEIRKQIELYKEQKNLDLSKLTQKYGNVNTEEIEKFKNTLNSINESNFNKGELNNQFAQLQNNIKNTSQALKEGENSAKGFADEVVGSAGKFASWLLLGNLVVNTIHFFTEGIQYTKELNDQLTQISVVTGKSQSDLQQYLSDYTNLAQQMSVTTQDVASAAVEFYRQGLNQSEVMERLKTTTEYAKISNLGFQESAEILTATVNSMGVSIERASDVFAYLGDATATGADEIGKAFQRVGGTAAALNVDFEKVSSWIAVVSSKTRESAESIGNGIKSIMARYSQLREKGFTEDDGTKVNNVAKALATAGITMMDAQGQFRDFGTVMDELGGKWNGLDRIVCPSI